MKALLLTFVLVLTPLMSEASSQCESMRKALYSKPTVRVKVVFGYKDARPARYVGDRHERVAFIEEITAPCASGQRACGFARSEIDADLFKKTVVVDGRPRNINLWVVNSSVGSDDEENRDDPFQAWKSRQAKLSFEAALQDSDVVFYNGHSRFGGGPDFTSPALQKDGAVDPAVYKKKRKGIKNMLASLEETYRPKDKPFSKLKVLGLYSCSSSQLFNRDIRRVSDAGVISSHQLMYYTDALDQSLADLDSLLASRCPKSITF